MPGFNIGGTPQDAVDAKTDVYRSYRWKILNLPNINRECWGFVLDCTLPAIDFDVLAVQGMSLDYKVPQKPNFPNADVTFYDFGTLQSEFEKWIAKIWDPYAGLYAGKAPSDIKGMIKLASLNNAGREQKIYTLHGAWPKRMSHSKLSMSDNSLKTLVVEFVYDFYVIEDKK